jgi:hypothetical protein
MESRRFIFDGNAQEVIKVTDGRVTGYIAASIPPEVLQLWHCRLTARLKRMQRLKFRVRPHKRLRSKPKRARTRRQRPEKRHRGRVRYRTDGSHW